MYKWERYRVSVVRSDEDASFSEMNIENPEKMVELFQVHQQEVDQESVWVASMDHQNTLMGIQELYRGTVSDATIRTAEILRSAILMSATSFMIIHNHPTGAPTPSIYDRETARSLVSAAVVFDIEFYDSIIVGADGRWASIRKETPELWEIGEKEALPMEIALGLTKMRSTHV